MLQHPEISAAQIESTFGSLESSNRFARFCNALIVSETTGSVRTPPILSEKPGADGGIDGEWQISDNSSKFSSPFVLPGWNVFQFKARGIAGGGQTKAISGLRNSLSGALKDVTGRTDSKRAPGKFVVFTNLQLGLATKSRTKRGASISANREKLVSAIREGFKGKVEVEVVDAGQLAAMVNRHADVRLAFFEPSIAGTWNDKWEKETKAKDYKVPAPFSGRTKELNEVKEWLGNTSVKVIAICGPSGMGKTRLALEATSDNRIKTTVVEAVAEFERWGIVSLPSTGPSRIYLIEDPSEDQARRLTTEALTAHAVKVIFTFPSDAKTPRLKLTEHDAVRELTLNPLSREDSRSLLLSTGVRFDTAAENWVLQQAGGVPEILLSAAELQRSNTLRDKSKSLRARLAEEHGKRVERELGNDGLRTLTVLSLLHWVNLASATSEFDEMIRQLDPLLPSSVAAGLLPKLEKAGYLRRRGNHVSVNPPLFASALAEPLFANPATRVCKLFDDFSDQQKEHLLERVVATELESDASLFDHIFNSALGKPDLIVARISLLDYLARAIPSRTARFLESNFDHLHGLFGPNSGTAPRSRFFSILRDLAFDPGSCAISMRLLQKISILDPEDTGSPSAKDLFKECFVHWFVAFPLDYEKREEWVRNMLSSNDPLERRLAAEVVVTITAPPRSLSGFSVNARRLGSAPEQRLWSEVYSYLDHMVALRFELCGDKDMQITTIAREQFAFVFSDQNLAVEDSIKHLTKLVKLNRSGLFPYDEREIRSSIFWLENAYTRSSKEIGQRPHVRKWRSALSRLKKLRLTYEAGSFDVRLKLAVGRPSGEGLEKTKRGEYVYQQNCREISKEAARSPRKMTKKCWQIIGDSQAQHAPEFLQYLGQSDTKRHFLSKLRARMNDPQRAQDFGCYLHGLRNHSPRAVEKELDGLRAETTVENQLILPVIKVIGPTDANRKRLLHVIRASLVEPISVASTFSWGRWLDDLPHSEVQEVVEFVSQAADDWPRRVIQVLTIYVHGNRPLPKELFDVAIRALKAVCPDNDHLDWDCDHVGISLARADETVAFSLLGDGLAILKANQGQSWLCRSKWVPFRRYHSIDFWEFLRKLNPNKAYRSLLTLIDVTEFHQAVLDLTNHRKTLITICSEHEENAIFFARLASGIQQGFFLFAYDLLKGFRDSTKLRKTLSRSAIYREVAFGTDEEKMAKSLAQIETEIAAKSTPPDCIRWLEETKAWAVPLASNRSQRREDEYLGWE